MPQRRLTVIGLLACLLVAAGCGGSGTHAVPPGAITLTANSFSPDARTIKQGERLTFVNQRGALHILALGQHGASRDQPGAPSFGGAAGHRAERGQVWTTPAWTTAGAYHVTCTVHPGMNLTVTVT